MIPNLIIGDLQIDCANPQRARDFYAALTGWEKTIAWDCPALITGIGLRILFAPCDFDYIPPVWPEEPGKQQKQMHLDITVGNLRVAIKKAIRLGAVKAKKQYGGSHITLLDTEGHPFCLCERSKSKSEFDLYFEEKSYGRIRDISINIDCQTQKNLRDFYAQLTDWDRDFHWSALVADNGMIICFQGCDKDATMDDYIPPVWPEEPGKQQKQMHFNFQADDLPAAVEEAIRLGAVKAAKQYGGEQFVTMIDTEGHPFCLCRR